MGRLIAGVTLLLSLSVTACLATFGPRGAIAGAATPVLGIREALASCHAHPISQVLLLRGWFIALGGGAGSLDGVLFDSPNAVPLTTVGVWDDPGYWKRYGALSVRIRTHGSYRSGWLTLHGLLDCRSGQFSTDRNPFPPPQISPVYAVSRGPGTGGMTTSATAGGLKLTLQVTRLTYPRNALALMTVEMQNVSNHTIGYLSIGVHAPGLTVPQVEVLDSSNRIVFPPAMPYYPPLPGPGPFVATLQPGHAVTQRAYVILRGTRIRASQQFTPNPRSAVSRGLVNLRTRPILVTLTSESTPVASVRQDEGASSIEVTRPTGVTGKPLLLSYADCGFPNFAFTDWTLSNLHITPGCSPVDSWHLRVAWLNHSVAAVDYEAAQPTLTPMPAPSPTAAPTPTATLLPTGPSFAQILHRADVAMASVRSLHADGLHTAHDSSAQTDLSIHADCTSQNGSGLPVLLQSLQGGRYSAAGTTHAIGTDHLIDGPLIPQPATVTHTWERSPHGSDTWHFANLRKEWALDRGISDDIVSPNAAYINQSCPSVIRPSYLHSPIGRPGFQPSVLGITSLAGHRVWHLREQVWFKIDFFVDTRSYRLIRLRLWDQSHASGTGWQVRFDYSGFNTTLRVPLPR